MMVNIVQECSGVYTANEPQPALPSPIIMGWRVRLLFQDPLCVLTFQSKKCSGVYTLPL